MKFIATVGNIKTFKDGGLRLDLDIPEIYQDAVLKKYKKFRDQNVDVVIELSTELEKLKKLRQQVHFLIQQYADQVKEELDIVKTRILGSENMFPSKGYTSLKELTLEELEKLRLAIQELLPKSTVTSVY